MPKYSTNTITDILFKKVIYGVTETNSAFLATSPKEAAAESLSSLIPIYASKQLWAQSNLIPASAAALSGIVADHASGTNYVTLKADPTVSNPSRAWVAVSNPSGSVTDPANRMMDWISPWVFDPSYAVHIFHDNANVPGNEISWSTTNTEWYFDYQAGVLYWTNEGTYPVPPGTSSPYTSFAIKGYRYIGTKGVTGAGAASSTHVVANIAARDAITGQVAGDMAYVIDASADSSGDVASGEYATYLWTGSAWNVLNTQDSAAADVGSVSFDITNLTANSSGTIYTVRAGTRVVNVDVTVPDGLTGSPDLKIGDATVADRHMDVDRSDLRAGGVYTSTSNYKYATATPITYTYNHSTNSTSGTITINVVFGS